MGQVKQPLFKFKPFSLKQKKVLTWWLPNSPVCDYDGIICDGSIRSGKTVSMALSFVMWAMENHREQNFAMCGKTISSFRRNVLMVLKLMLASRGYKIKDHRADNYIEISFKDKVNHFYIFGGKDERSQDLIQGITLAGVLFDEVALMPESFVNQATGRCSVDGSKFWFNCNPDGPYHWFKTGWIDNATEKNLIYIHFTMTDNTSLSQEIINRYMNMYSGVFYRRYILGEWCKAEGLVYPMFEKERHVCSTNPLTTNVLRYYVSVDYGTYNPFSAGLWAVDTFKKRAYRVGEYYYDGRKLSRLMTDEEYYKELERLIGNVPICYIVVDPSAASFIECIRRHGKFLVRPAVNTVLDGIRVVAQLLQSDMIMFDSSCKDAIREFGLYSWDDKAQKDEVLKEHDHAMDDIRYFCNTVLRREFRWVEWR